MAVTLVVTATIVLTWALWPRGSDAPQLRFQGAPDDRFGIAQNYDATPGGTTLGAIPLCMVKAGTAKITSLVPSGGAGGLKITAFAVRKGTAGSGYGAGHDTLQGAGFPTTAVVSTICGGASADELGITVQRTGTGNGQWENLKVNYVSGGKHGSAIIPMSLKLCGPDGRTDQTCGDSESP